MKRNASSGHHTRAHLRIHCQSGYLSPVVALTVPDVSVSGEKIAAMTTSDPDGLPHSRQRHGVCPRCNRVSNFSASRTESLVDVVVTTEDGWHSVTTERAFHVTCQGCQAKTVVIERLPDEPQVDENNDLIYEPIHWWPTPTALTGTTRGDVPADIADAFDEGVRCVSVLAPTAGVTMFRNTIAQIVNDKGSEQAKAKLLGSEKKFGNLSSAIKQMAEDRTLHDAFSAYADHVREVGNAGAHQESYETIPVEQAREVQELVGAMIDALYVQPAKWGKRMPATKKPNPGTGSSTPSSTP